MRAGVAAAALAIGLAAAACRPAPEAAPEVEAPPGVGAEAVRLYETRCAACHGPAGRGDGPRVTGLTVVPPDFATAEWQASASEERIDTVLLRGSAAAGLSNACPKNPDLRSRPALLAELRQLLRSFPR